METPGEPEPLGSTTTAASAVPASRRANLFGHDSLAGHYRTRLEASGRLVLPAALRAPFVAASAGHLVPVDGVLWLATPQAFEVLVDHHAALNAGMVADEFRPLMFQASPRVSVDRQARLVVPPEQRSYASLLGEADVVLAGSVEHVEIWAATRWEAEQAPKVADVTSILKGGGGLPTGTA